MRGSGSINGCAQLFASLRRCPAAKNFTEYRPRLQLVYFDWTIARSSTPLVVPPMVSYAVAKALATN
jgi:hypothetical protein